VFGRFDDDARYAPFEAEEFILGICRLIDITFWENVHLFFQINLKWKNSYGVTLTQPPFLRMSIALSIAG